MKAKRNQLTLSFPKRALTKEHTQSMSEILASKGPIRRISEKVVKRHVFEMCEKENGNSKQNMAYTRLKYAMLCCEKGKEALMKNMF